MIAETELASLLLSDGFATRFNYSRGWLVMAVGTVIVICVDMAINIPLESLINFYILTRIK